jgi:polyisoprenyl-phosphate glycosyltransferase
MAEADDRRSKAASRPAAGPMASIDISVVAPLYDGESFIEELIGRLGPALSSITDRYEIVLVDDGSTDGTWAQIDQAGRRDRRVRAIRLSRNFGQHPAITAGIDHALGDWIVVMDGDLQDRAEDIPRLHQTALDGKFDMVVARRRQHDISVPKKLSSVLFNWALARLGGIEADQKIGNYRIFSRRVAEAFALHREQCRFFPALMARLGFKVGFLDVDRESRPLGKSTYSPRMLTQLATDAIIANSEQPLRLGFYLGGIVAVVTLVLAFWAAVRAALFGVHLGGWAIVLMALAFFAGVQLAFSGLVGLYVGRIFHEAKQRPLYLVAESVNLDASGPTPQPKRLPSSRNLANEPIE